MQPSTQYAKSGDVHIAYQVFGEGAHDLVFIPGFVSHIDTYWDEPSCARWMRRLGNFSRVIRFDKRGTGLSDQVSELPGMDQRLDDVSAVMDAVGIERAVIFGASEGGSFAALFAATHPERTQALIIIGGFAQFSSWIPTQETLERSFLVIFANDDTISEEELRMLEKIVLEDKVIDEDEKRVLKKIFSRVTKEQVADTVWREITDFRQKHRI